jgi:hypothetical protein
MSFVAVAAGTAAATGLYGIGKGIVQGGKANRLLNSLKYPDQQIPQEVLANQKMAQMNALTGLPSEQYKQVSQNIQRNTNNAIAQAADRRAGIGTIGAIQGSANDAAASLGVADAQARQANQRTLYGINSEVGRWRDQVWRNNVKDKYDRDYNYGMSLKGSANQNIDNGVDRLGSAAAMALSAKSGDNSVAQTTATANKTAMANTSMYNKVKAANAIDASLIPHTYNPTYEPPVPTRAITPSARLFGGSVGYGRQPNWDEIDWTRKY